MSCGEPKDYMDRIIGNPCNEGEEQGYVSCFEGVGDAGFGFIDPSALEAATIPEGSILVSNNNAEWVHMVPPVTEIDGIERMCINGKDYLLIDDSGPEEMNPHKLQEQIVELTKERDEYRDKLHFTVQPQKVQENLNSLAPTYSELMEVPFGPYGGCAAGYAGVEFSIDFEDINLNEEECKLVSAEEADYDRAMKIIG